MPLNHSMPVVDFGAPASHINNQSRYTEPLSLSISISNLKLHYIHHHPNITLNNFNIPGSLLSTNCLKLHCPSWFNLSLKHDLVGWCLKLHYNAVAVVLLDCFYEELWTVLFSTQFICSGRIIVSKNRHKNRHENTTLLST